MSEFLAFVEAHPALFSVLVWPLLTAIITAVFKPRTPEEYDALPPRVAAALKLVAALGLDPVKGLEALKQLLAPKPKDGGQ